MAHRASVLLLFAALFSVVLLFGDRTSEARHWENVKLNCELEIPDTWDWMKQQKDWTKQGIVKGARRALTELKGGKPADGEGALLHLAVRDAPEGEDENAPPKLEDVARSSDVTSFFLTRFKGSKPEIKYDDTGLVLKGDLPAVVLEVEGRSLNFKVKERDVNGIMVVTIAKKKLYMLRMFAFPTEFDDEGLKVDIDFTAYDGFDIINPSEDKKHEADPNARGDAPEDPDEEERIEEDLDFEDVKLRMTKHKQLTQVEPLESEGEDVVVKFERSDQYGSYVVRVIAIPLDRMINGVRANPPATKPAVTTDFWNGFINSHPKGAIYSYKWPKKTKNKTMLTFPVVEEGNRFTVVKEGKKRPIDPKSSDIFKKMKFAQKAKNNFVGKGRKVSEAFRGMLHGNQPGQGQHYVAKFGFRTAFHTYRIYVGFYKEGYKTWGEAVRLTLESMAFYK